MRHWIQTYILEQLVRSATRRYTELKPRDVESNLFMYHLKNLVREGLIEKDEKVYTLSQKGLRYVATLSLKMGKLRKQPQILNAIIARNSQERYLFSKWHRQPNTGLISFPHGMMHYGEPLLDAAKRELAEKAGLTADMIYKGSAYIRTLANQETDRHMLVQLFEAVNIQEGRQDEYRHDVAENFWAHPEDLSPALFIPGFYEITQRVLASKYTHQDIEVRL